MKKLNKSTTYAILWLNHSGKSIEDISLDLSLDPSSVKAVIEKHFTNPKENEIKTQTNPVSSLMIKKSQVKDSPVSIMTKEASQQTDSIKDSQNTTSSKYSKNIHKIL
jgi:LEA14-like dessication related protein